MSSDQSATPKLVAPPKPDCAFLIAQCARWEALAACIEASYDSPSWIGEAIAKVRELNR